MISKSLIDVGVVLDSGVTEGKRGDSGTLDNEAVGLTIGGAALDCRLLRRRPAVASLSWGETIGETGGVMRSLGSRFCGDLRERIPIGAGRLSLRSMGGGISSGVLDATIGAANASGDDIDDGVDERVWKDEVGQ